MLKRLCRDILRAISNRCQPQNWRDGGAAESHSLTKAREARLLKEQGDKCVRINDWVGAIDAYRRALDSDPDFGEIRINIAFALSELGQFDEARHHLQCAIKQNIALFDCYFILGTIAQRSDAIEEAIDQYGKAISISPASEVALETLGKLLREQGMVPEAIEYYRRALASDASAIYAHSGLLFTLQHQSGLSRAEIYEEHLRFAAQFETPIKPDRRRFAERIEPRPTLRIGYVSSDFRAHSVALFLLPVLEAHDVTKFEIHCYYNDTAVDAITEKIQSCAHRFVSCVHMSDDDLANDIFENQIDILVDLNGHTGNHRLSLFARSPAPIQISYLGYVDTTGLTSIDYRLSNADADPPGSERYYSERLFRFENMMWWCYRPYGTLPSAHPLPAREKGGITFVSPNNIAKISDEVIDTWSEILKRVPNSELLIMAIPSEFASRRLSEEFRRRGIAHDRLVFHQRIPLERYRMILSQADIMLDTFPFNGGTTTCEALWLSLPMIALKGNSFHSRMGYSILNKIGLPELVATDPGEYVKIACELASDWPRLCQLREGMRGRLETSSLSDTKRFTKALEGAYQEMWKDWATSSLC